MHKSNLLGFIGDFGDVIGGICLGDASHNGSITETIVGIGLILVCVYIKFYHSTKTN